MVEELGGGGFGVVYRARDTVAGIEVAVKGLPTLVQQNREELDRVRENFGLVSRLHHPHIAAPLMLHEAQSVWYADETVRRKLRVQEGDFLFVMSFAPGVTLSRWRRQFPEGKVPVEQALAICAQIAEALDYAHSQKIIHRDIKPANVMVESRSQKSEVGDLTLRVLDFGLAAEIRSSMSRVSRETGDTSGTRPYMAPEQWQGRKQGAATDLYALAVLFYELVSGAVPFAPAFETGDPVIMSNVVTRELPDPLKELSKRQNAALLRGLAKSPGERFASCMEFVSALGHGISVRSGQPHYLKMLINSALIVAGVVTAAWWGRTLLHSQLVAIEERADAEATRRLQIAAMEQKIRDALGRGNLDMAGSEMSRLVEIAGAKGVPDSLRALYEAAVGEREVIALLSDAKPLYENALQIVTDPGLGDLRVALERAWNRAEIAVNLERWGVAAGEYTEIIALARHLHGLDRQRAEAESAQTRYLSSRQKAASHRADLHASNLWEDASISTAAASVAFAKGDFAEARDAWNRSEELLVAAAGQSETRRAEHGQRVEPYRKAAGTARKAAEQVNAAIESVELWNRAIAEQQAAEQAFANDHFDEARAQWEDAATHYSQAVEIAQAAQRLRLAKLARTAAQEACRQAEQANANRDASQPWGQAENTMKSAQNHFDANRLTEAQQGWETAQHEYQTARTAAIDHQSEQRRLQTEQAAKPSAEQARTEARSARLAAEQQNAEKDAVSQWRQAAASMDLADQAFRAGRYSEAQRKWSAAANEFSNAQSAARETRQMREKEAAARRSAETARQQAMTARQQAQNANAEQDGRYIWNQGVNAMSRADSAFTQSRFRDAENDWKEAEGHFHNAQSSALTVQRERASIRKSPLPLLPPAF